jgi:hypothetical protein
MRRKLGIQAFVWDIFEAFSGSMVWSQEHMMFLSRPTRPGSGWEGGRLLHLDPMVK